MNNTEKFVHLHVHSDYTLSKGASKVKELIYETYNKNIPAFALTDEANMYAALDFSTYCQEKGIQPIIGVKLWINVGLKNLTSIILLSKNENGYMNICKILANSHKPRNGNMGGLGIIDPDFLNLTNTQNIIVLTGSQQDGILYSLIKNNKENEAKETLEWLRYLFGKNLYVEICRQGNETKEEIDIEKKLIELALNSENITDRYNNISKFAPLVATTEIWYAKEDEHITYELLKSIEAKNFVTATNYEISPSINKRYYIKTASEMKELFKDLPEAYENAILIAKRCSFIAKKRKPILPPFQTGEGRTETEELRLQANQGLEKIFKKLKIKEEDKETYIHRLEFELAVIEKMKFPGYFLIVSDFIKWAKNNDIPVGPGRGSGAGSLVAYSLEITDINPLQYNLLFERFLNPDRVSMPDFDVDFCQDRRDEVISYVREKYGEDYVSLIATFGEIKSKTAISDIGRIIKSNEFGGYGFLELKDITKIIPMIKMTPEKLQDAYNNINDSKFRNKIDSDRKYELLYKNALRVEGLFRQQGTHAAGVVISGQPLEDLVPVGWDQKKQISVCQFNMKATENAGLVKFDFLGLKTLSIIKETLNNIKNTTGENIDISLIPHDDKETFEMISKCLTNSVFQIESEGMKKAIAGIKPTCIEDIIAIVALYRPGPMEMIPIYGNRKNGLEEIEYPKPEKETENILKETFGIIIYQEQVMQIAQAVAGYSLGQADLLRRAMGKKIKKEMDDQREVFVEGAIKKGVEKDDAESLFDLLAKFADYGFNKSHAAAYAWIAYQTAWLKRHYPVQFMAAMLTYEAEPEKMAKIKEDMDIFGIEMLPPSINKSYYNFVPEKTKDNKLAVRFGLAAIKTISGKLEEFTLIRKNNNNRFNTIEEFYTKAGHCFKKDQYEKLAEVGAFDELSKNRYSALSSISWLIAKGSKKVNHQNDLFGGSLEITIPKEVTDVQEWGDVADKEFNAVGFYFIRHPLDYYTPKLKALKVKRRISVLNFMEERKIDNTQDIKLSGLVESFTKKVSEKNGKNIINALISEKTEKYNVIFTKQENIEEINFILERAKIGRKPVIILCNVKYDKEKPNKTTLWGTTAYDIDELFEKNGLSGNLILEIEPERIIKNLTEVKEIEKIENNFKNNLINKNEKDERIEGIYENITKRKLNEIINILERNRNDEHKRSKKITIKLIHNSMSTKIELNGKYLLDKINENTIKATDGITSIKEEIIE